MYDLGVKGQTSVEADLGGVAVFEKMYDRAAPAPVQQRAHVVHLPSKAKSVCEIRSNVNCFCS